MYWETIFQHYIYFFLHVFKYFLPQFTAFSQTIQSLVANECWADIIDYYFTTRSTYWVLCRDWQVSNDVFYFVFQLYVTQSILVLVRFFLSQLKSSVWGKIESTIIPRLEYFLVESKQNLESGCWYIWWAIKEIACNAINFARVEDVFVFVPGRHGRPQPSNVKRQTK